MGRSGSKSAPAKRPKPKAKKAKTTRSTGRSGKKTGTAKTRKPAKRRASKSVKEPEGANSELQPAILETVEQLMSTGMSRARVIINTRTTMPAIDLSDRQLDRYIARVKQLWRERASEHRDDRIAEHDATLRQAQEQAFKVGRPAAAVSAVRTRAQLFGDFPPDTPFKLQVAARATAGGGSDGAGEQRAAEALLLVKLERLLDTGESDEPILELEE